MKTSALLALVCLAAWPAHAEDPFLGQIKAIKCVNCRPGWVDIVVHDPIDVRDFEIAVRDVDYNKVVTPLPGKRIHDKDGAGACFYWFELPKGAKPPESKPKRPPAPVVTPQPRSDSSEARAGGDSAGVPGPSVTALDSTLLPPPALPEPEGPPPTPSRCLPYVKMAPPPSPKKAGD